MAEEPILPGLSHRFKEGDADYRIAKPFGPNILETRLPDRILEAMRALTERVLNDHERASYGRYLVGQIREEPEIPESLLREYGVYDYITGMFASYVVGCMYCDADIEYKRGFDELKRSGQFRNPTRVNLEAAWIISQREGEYNPIHSHSLATLSSVMYLHVPEALEKDVIPGKIPTDGHIEMVDRSAGPMQNSTVRIRPAAGKFFIFPSTLLHLVYPFRGGEERRSVSINASHTI